MNDPIQLLLLDVDAPDLVTSAYGPFVETPIESLDDLTVALNQQAYDAAVLSMARPSVLANWPGLSRAVLDAAVLVLSPEPEAAEALRLIRLGVQEVLPQRDVAGVGTLARLVRQAVERKRLERAARKAYATDLATGLPNHAQLMEHMTHLLALREREPAAMALLAVRLEGLAAAEARLGAEAANVLRRKAAVRLRACLRASDVVASVGHDCYAVLLAWIDEPAAGEAVAAKVLQALRRPFSVTGQDLLLAVSVGVAQYPGHGKEAQELLQRALAQAEGVVAVGAAVEGRRVLRSMDSAANDEL
jgi:diguanylate cyclase (GGDEF)-like protein